VQLKEVAVTNEINLSNYICSISFLYNNAKIMTFELEEAMIPI
jgi:hypothetical protein